MLDTENLTVSPDIMIEMIRTRQEDIAIILAPDQPEAHELAASYGAQAVVDLPVMARDLIPLLNQSLETDIGSLPGTPAEPADDSSEDTIKLEALVGDALGEATGLNFTRRRLQASLDLLNPDPPPEAVSDAMDLLVEPEAEGDTVRYRIVRVGDGGIQIRDMEADETPVSAASDFETLRDLAEQFGADVSQASPPAPDSSAVAERDEFELDDSAAFERMLNAVLDESTLLEDLTMESLFGHHAGNCRARRARTPFPHGCGRPRSSFGSRPSCPTACRLWARLKARARRRFPPVCPAI